jgi:replication factor C subunit 3/5
MLLTDKYRPLCLDKIDCHPALAKNLKNLARSDDFPHLLFYGPSGAGKKTLVMATLRELFGAGVEKLRLEPRSFKVANRNEPLELNIIASSHHLELNPSDCGFYDRVVVQEVIKEIAASQPIGGSVSGPNESGTTLRAFKVLILNEVDKMSVEAQHALRRTMEKYMATCRLILVAQSQSRLTPALLSRCLTLRVPAPSEAQIVTVLHHVSKREGWSIPDTLAKDIAKLSHRNLRRALLILEATKIKHFPHTVSPTGHIVPEQADWETYIDLIAAHIARSQSPQDLLQVRSKLYELLVHCIPPEVVLKRLTLALLPKLDNELKPDIAKWAAFYEHRLQCGSKPIFHLEAFVAQTMSLYKTYLLRVSSSLD